ncbi:MAG: hypothetical protein LUG64_02375 [Clostridiales bacterium]|nr:hypothetical protein [Clostridiales bacterium]
MKCDDFNEDRLSNEEKELNDYFAWLGQLINESESGVSIAIPEKMRGVQVVYDIMKRIVKGVNVKMSCKVNQPYASTGAIIIVGKEIFITDPALFAQAMKLVSVWEVYPKTDGNIQLDLTFNGLTRKV